MYSFVKGGNIYRYLHSREQWPYWPEKKENPRQGCSPTGLSFTFWNKDLKEIFNTLMTIARVKLLMLLVMVILPRTALVLWILKFNINVRVIPTIHTSLCPIFVYIPKNYRSMLFFKFILTTKYFRQQPDSLRNLIDMFCYFYFRSILKCLGNIVRIVWMLRSLCSRALFARQRFVPIKCARRWKNRCIVCVNTILDR